MMGQLDTLRLEEIHSSKKIPLLDKAENKMEQIKQGREIRECLLGLPTEYVRAIFSRIEKRSPELIVHILDNFIERCPGGAFYTGGMFYNAESCQGISERIAELIKELGLSVEDIINTRDREQRAIKLYPIFIVIIQNPQYREILFPGRSNGSINNQI